MHDAKHVAGLERVGVRFIHSMVVCTRVAGGNICMRDRCQLLLRLKCRIGLLLVFPIGFLISESGLRAACNLQYAACRQFPLSSLQAGIF